MSRDVRSTGTVRESASGRVGARPARAVVWRLLPPQRAVLRVATRLLGAGVGCLAVGLPGLARVASRGSVSSLRAGLLAVGYACLALAATVPVLYWAAVLCIAVMTLVARRWLAAWRRLRTVRAEQVSDPGSSLRL